MTAALAPAPVTARPAVSDETRNETRNETPVERPPLKGVQLKNYRKCKLMRRDGKRCFYCYRPFTRRMTGATIDHVVPHCLFRTNALVNVVLACGPCNQAKADRLPLSIALLLCAYTDHSRPDTGPDTVDAGAPRAWGVHESARSPRVPPASTSSTFSTGGIGRAGWLALARLAHANESARRSTPDLRGSTPHGWVNPPGGQVDPPTRPPVNTDDGTTVSIRESTVSAIGSAVSARPDRRSVPVFVSTCPAGGEVAA
jgi:hypothetical protein